MNQTAARASDTPRTDGVDYVSNTKPEAVTENALALCRDLERECSARLAVTEALQNALMTLGDALDDTSCLSRADMRDLIRTALEGSFDSLTPIGL